MLSCRKKCETSMEWMYYNHAMIPATPPHIDVDISPIQDNSIWKMKKSGEIPLLARWTTEYDCGYETEWYYCIKDTPFELDNIKSKFRCDIRKGLNFFMVKRIDPCEHIQEIWDIQVEAYSTYKKMYRPRLEYKKLEKEILTDWKEKIVFGAFKKDTGEMVSYSIFLNKMSYIEFAILKSKPECERLKVNAAMIAECLFFFNEDIRKGIYICDGERNILHQTTFQDYLERTFKFRKAYCKVNVVYRPVVGIVVNCLFPIRKMFKNSSNKLCYYIYGVLQLEEIYRKQQKNVNKEVEIK